MAGSPSIRWPGRRSRAWWPGRLGRASVVEDDQLQAAEPLGVGQELDLGDPAVGDGEAVDDPGPTEQWVRELLDAGAEQVQAVSDAGGGKLVATVRDADGNFTGLIQSP
jgi:hypothetical protein